MSKCKSANKYKGIHAPKCNKGEGCDYCWKIYRQYHQTGEYAPRGGGMWENTGIKFGS